MVMEKRKTNERGSNHMKSQLERFMRRKGRQFCAAALCVLMLVSNVATSIGSTGEDSNEVAEFTVDRDSLCVELVKAVERGKTVKNTLEFDGEEADTYAELFDADGTLYKLKPEIKDNASKLSLTVYARLGEELEKEDRQNYEIDGSEEIIFLLKNEADREQTAVIRVGDKCSEEITVAAKSAVGVTEEETVEEPAAGPAGENAASGDGSEAGGAAAEETVSDETLPAEESTAATDTEESNEEISAPAEDAGDQETAASEQEGGSEIEAPKEDKENTAEPGEGQEEAVDQDEEKNENESGVTEENGTGAESGTAEGGDATEKADDGQTAGDDSKSEQGADHSSASEGGSSDNEENSDTGSSDSSDSGDSDSDDSVTASISVHNVARVMTTVEAASGATPQEAEKEETVVEVLNEEEDEETEDEDEATPSEATPSELWELFDGECFNAVRLGDGAAVAFVTTAEELGLDDEIYEAELDNVIVRVTANRGILPEDAELYVTELTEDDEETAEQYREAKKALDEDGAEYDGMMALDISFYDAEGNELEPEDGTVRVFIEMKPEALPEDVASETVAVQHLKETEDGKIKVERVADASDETAGTIKLKDATENEGSSTVAEFEVDSFSSFTITWTDNNKSIFKVTAEIVNTNGTELSHPAVIGLKIGETIELTEQVSYEGLHCKGVYYNSKDGSSITTITSQKYQKNGWFGTKYTAYKLIFKNGDTVVATLDSNEWDSAKTATIYYVFESEIVEPTEPTLEKSLTRKKTAVENPDGTYDISLTISGAVGKSTVVPKIDILLIVDSSGSMSELVRINGVKKSRMKWTQEAVKSLTNMLDEKVANNNVDVHYSYVDFDTDVNGSNRILDWTDSSNEINDKIKNVDYSSWSGGGTNYQAAIEAGKNQLKDARSDAQTYVIFLTDGIPTFRNEVTVIGADHDDCGYHDQYNVCGNGQNDNKGYNIAAAVESIKGMSCTAFYAIGFGTGFGTNLEQLCNNAGTGDGAHVGSAKDYTTADNVLSVFNKISADITSVLCDHVSVVDTLSENVKAVLNTDNTPTKLIAKAIDTNKYEYGGTGNTVIAPKSEQNSGDETSRTIRAEYDSANKQIKLVFPESYKLEAGLEYTVTMTVDASEQAYDTYASLADYPNTADEDTGTHSSEKGLFSNESATVTYTYNGEVKIEDFAKPVIQLKAGTLTLKKTFNGLADMDDTIKTNLLKNFRFKVNLEYPGDDGNVKKIEKSISLFDEGVELDTSTNTFTYVMKGLHPNTTVTVEETGTDAEGFNLKKDVAGKLDGVDITLSDEEKKSGSITINGIGKGSKAEADFTNNYTVIIVPPTGIFTTNLPHLLMLAFAFFSTAVLLLFSYKRKVRRAE
ncbi:MAG: VWA domain-containing protein [Otoolea sp.]